MEFVAIDFSDINVYAVNKYVYIKYSFRFELLKEFICDCTMPHPQSKAKNIYMESGLKTFPLTCIYHRSLSALQCTRTNVKVEACYEEQSYKKKQGIFHEVPLFDLKQKYTSEEGKKFVEKVVASQGGRNHPLFKGDPDMKLYKIFVRSETKDGSSTATSSRVKAGGGVHQLKTKPQKRMCHLLFANAMCPCNRTCGEH